jgi:hypothetical protein
VLGDDFDVEEELEATATGGLTSVEEAQTAPTGQRVPRVQLSGS